MGFPCLTKPVYWGIVCKNIRSMLFAHHLVENIDLNLNYFIPVNPFDVVVETYDIWNIAMCFHSFKHFECMIQPTHLEVKINENIQNSYIWNNICFNHKSVNKKLRFMSMLSNEGSQ